MLALRGTAEGMNGRAYNEISSMRFWGAACADDGARAISILLKNPPSDGKQVIGFLELMDCDVGPRGMTYFGDCLGQGGNLTLMGIELNHNKGMTIYILRCKYYIFLAMLLFFYSIFTLRFYHILIIFCIVI